LHFGDTGGSEADNWSIELPAFPWDPVTKTTAKPLISLQRTPVRFGTSHPATIPAQAQQPSFDDNTT
jgi:hypothetical protein